MKTRLHLALAAACIVSATIFSTAHAASFSAGLSISEEVLPEKTGMRVYPGAMLVEKKKDHSESANIQFSFGDYGLKVVAAKLRSDDAPDKVAAFYRDELARFGDVLDCSMNKSDKSDDVEIPHSRGKKSRVLTCGSDKPHKNGLLYKAGRKDDQHVVEIKPHGNGSEFSLVYVNVRSPD